MDMPYKYTDPQMANDTVGEGSRRYRPQRGSLEDSMAECVTVGNLQQLAALIRTRLHDYCDVTEIRVTPYCGEDARIGWKETWAVQIKGCADSPDTWTMNGFLDGPLNQ